MKFAGGWNVVEVAILAVSTVIELINPETGETKTEDERSERIRLDKLSQLTEKEYLLMLHLECHRFLRLVVEAVMLDRVEKVKLC
mmetsp:Transcript_44590/g.45089  ORF Transcript_44590/g.45089 Transcript_44590/m.45089 type:complete len:85 (-) Transcript_44590:183-437(-)